MIKIKLFLQNELAELRRLGDVKTFMFIS